MMSKFTVKQAKQLALLDARKQKHQDESTKQFLDIYYVWQDYEPGMPIPALLTAGRGVMDSQSLSLTLSTSGVKQETIDAVQHEVRAEDVLILTKDTNKICISFKDIEARKTNKVMPCLYEHATGMFPINNLHNVDEAALIELAHRVNIWTSAGVSGVFELQHILFEHKQKILEWCRVFIAPQKSHYEYDIVSGFSTWNLIIKHKYTTNIGRCVYSWAEMCGMPK